MRGSRSILLYGIALAGLAVSGAAHAQATSEQMLAQSLFDEGRQLMDRGRHAEACPKLAESQRLDPGGGTLLNLAICHEKEGKSGSAYLELRAAASQASKDGRKDREKIANEHLTALASRVPKLSVHVVREEAGLEVRVDGTLIRKPAWDLATVVDPGAHLVEATAPGKSPFRQTITLAEGEQRTVQIAAFETSATNAASAATSAVPDVPANIAPERKTNPWFIASLVTSITGFSVGVPAAYVWGMMKISEPACKPIIEGREPAGIFCTSPAVRDGWFAAAAVGLALGVVGTIGIAVLPRKIEIAPAAAGNAGGVTLVGTF